MRNTRLAHHYVFKIVKRKDKEIISESFAEADIDIKIRDCWSEVKRMRRESATTSNTVDGLATP
jgi:hypothetical protein